MRGFFLWEKIEFFQREVKELNTTVSLTPRTQNIFKLGHGTGVPFWMEFPTLARSQTLPVVYAGFDHRQCTAAPIFKQENFGRFSIVTRLTADAMHKE